MLFLAVTLGFFAENFREHQIEKSRERRFIRIVHEDLRNDITALGRLIQDYQARIRREDSLKNLLAGGNFTATNDLYFLARVTSIRNFFHHSRNGFQQLKNAGGLRMIGDIELVQKIQSYENEVDEIEELQRLTEDLLMSYREVMPELFQGRVFKDMLIDPSTNQVDSRFARPTGHPGLMTKNPATINHLLIKAIYVNNNSYALMNRYKDILEKAESLKQQLSEKYGLEEPEAD
jgi:hypothetical protein